jgi:hypothetical protein
MCHYHPFARAYRERILAGGYLLQKWSGAELIAKNCKHLSWELLLALALQDHSSHMIQFLKVTYLVTPILANDHNVAYRATI